MKRVLDPIRVEYINGTDWRLLDSFYYRLGDIYGPEFVVVMKDFITNFGSVPRLFWWLVLPTGRYAPAFLVHDRLFRAPVIRTDMSARAASFSEANAVMFEIMGVIDDAKGGTWLQRRAWATTRAIAWTAIATGGRLAWNRYRSADREAVQTEAKA